MEEDFNLQALLIKIENKLEVMIKWLEDLGFCINKNEVCLFFNQAHELIDDDMI